MIIGEFGGGEAPAGSRSCGSRTLQVVRRLGSRRFDSVRLPGSRAIIYKTRNGVERLRGADDLSSAVRVDPCEWWAEQRTMFPVDGLDDDAVGIA